ncbi:MAG: hypothetical protein LKJ43_02885 [Lentilactobacillus buchneri]|jgi:hypothetical protein|nr:hypothetical protein [Lentilactobacillus buchneri]MCI1950657.1 hypothetical protein [Lentilactobacillus buchneri]MCI2018266.1 hypothetical protein [Lentilactobacillus buchneri]MCI2027783.1 hypothetical protein [Lentilactobacillus buchneri]
MAQHYVQLNEQGYITRKDEELTKNDDPKQWKQITIATDDEIDFGVNYKHYRVDETGVVHAPANSDLPTVEQVNKQLAVAQDTIKQQSELIEKQAQELTAIQTSLVEATKAQVEAGQLFDQKTKEYQQTFLETTKQIMQLQADIDTLKGAK